MQQAVYRSRRSHPDEAGELRPSLRQLIQLLLCELASLASLAVAITASLLVATNWLL